MFFDQTITSGNRYPKWARVPLLFAGGNEQTLSNLLASILAKVSSYAYNC